MNNEGLSHKREAVEMRTSRTSHGAAKNKIMNQPFEQPQNLDAAECM